MQASLRLNISGVKRGPDASGGVVGGAIVVQLSGEANVEGATLSR